MFRLHAKANDVWECGNSLQYCAFRKELTMVLPALSNRGQGYRSARTHPGSNLACFLSLSYPHTHTLQQKWLYLQRLYIQSRLTLLDWTKSQSTPMTLSPALSRLTVPQGGTGSCTYNKQSGRTQTCTHPQREL